VNAGRDAVLILLGGVLAAAGVVQRLDSAIYGGIALVILGVLGTRIQSLAIGLDGIKLELREIRNAIRAQAGVATAVAAAHDAAVDIVESDTRGDHG
jgi:hypothetical protein